MAQTTGNRSYSNDEQGLSTLEILVSFALAAPILTLLAAALHRSISVASTIQNFRSETYNTIRTYELLKGAVEDLDSHRFMISPRIHAAGTITFADGIVNPVMSGPAARLPAENSNPITSLKLDIKKSFLVVSSVMSGSRINYTACLKYPLASHDTPFRTENYKGFLGVSLEEIFELQGDTAPHAGRADCRDLNLAAVQSMSLPLPSPDAGLFALTLIPIVRQYTLYLDRSGVLRYLGHRGPENIENQPLVTGLRSVTLAPANIFDDQLLTVAATITSRETRPFETHLTHTLRREPTLNFLLNQ